MPQSWVWGSHTRVAVYTGELKYEWLFRLRVLMNILIIAGYYSTQWCSDGLMTMSNLADCQEADTSSCGAAPGWACARGQACRCRQAPPGTPGT